MKILFIPLAVLIFIAGVTTEAVAGPKEGRIVVNIRDNGDFTNEELDRLENEEALKIYIARQGARIEAEGQKPIMHLRGSKDAVFKHARIAVRAAAEVGVHNVLFATYDPPAENPAPADGPNPNAQPEPIRIPAKPVIGDWFIKPLIRPRDSDLDLALPGPARDKDKADRQVEPFSITIDGKGRILANDNVMDIDPKARELPLLDAALQFYKQGVDAAGEKARVQIFADDAAPHQRVIDVLNSLAGVGINSVTFTDVTKEKK